MLDFQLSADWFKAYIGYFYSLSCSRNLRWDFSAYCRHIRKCFDACNREPDRDRWRGENSKVENLMLQSLQAEYCIDAAFFSFSGESGGPAMEESVPPPPPGEIFLSLTIYKYTADMYEQRGGTIF